MIPSGTYMRANFAHVCFVHALICACLFQTCVKFAHVLIKVLLRIFVCVCFLLKQLFCLLL
jgi:hypothetical protein